MEKHQLFRASFSSSFVVATVFLSFLQKKKRMKPELVKEVRVLRTRMRSNNVKNVFLSSSSILASSNYFVKSLLSSHAT